MAIYRLSRVLTAIRPFGRAAMILGVNMDLVVISAGNAAIRATCYPGTFEEGKLPKARRHSQRTRNDRRLTAERLSSPRYRGDKFCFQGDCSYFNGLSCIGACLTSRFGIPQHSCPISWAMIPRPSVSISPSYLFVRSRSFFFGIALRTLMASGFSKSKLMMSLLVA